MGKIGSRFRQHYFPKLARTHVPRAAVVRWFFPDGAQEVGLRGGAATWGRPRERSNPNGDTAPAPRSTLGLARRTAEPVILPSLPTFSPGSTKEEGAGRELLRHRRTGLPRAALVQVQTEKRLPGFALMDPCCGVPAGMTEPRRLKENPGRPIRRLIGRCKFIHRISAHPLLSSAPEARCEGDQGSHRCSVSLAAPGHRAPPLPKAVRRGRGRGSCAASVSRAQG